MPETNEPRPPQVLRKKRVPGDEDEVECYCSCAAEPYMVEWMERIKAEEKAQADERARQAAGEKAT